MVVAVREVGMGGGGGCKARTRGTGAEESSAVPGGRRLPRL